jgi:hypothetical protein
MNAPPEAGNRERRGRAAALVENILIGASLPALWLWFLRRAGYRPFQGWWVSAVLAVVLLLMLAIALRRLSAWANLSWRESGSHDRRRNG